MKAKFLSIITILLFSCTSIFAQDVVTYTNINKTEQGCVKEHIVFDKDSSSPLKKNVYVEDLNGQKISKASYKWTNNKWVGVQKINYKFNADNQTTALVYLKWDTKVSDWSEKGEFFSYRYDKDGELLASIQVSISDSTNLISAVL